MDCSSVNIREGGDSFLFVSRRVPVQSISFVLSAILNLIKELPMAADKL